MPKNRFVAALRRLLSRPARRRLAAALALALLGGSAIQASAAVILDDDPPGNTVFVDQHFRRPRDARPQTAERDIFYSVSTTGIPGTTPAQRDASLRAVFSAIETWDSVSDHLNFINVTPGHADAGETAIAPVRNPANAGSGATIDVFWVASQTPGLTTAIRYAAAPTEAVHDEYTHVDILLARNMGIIDPAGAGVRRLDNPLTNPFSTFTTQALIDIESVALHEVGHTIGLDHPDEELQLNPTGSFSPFATDRDAARRNPAWFNNEDNFYRDHPNDGLPQPPYNIHNQARGTSSAVMNSNVLAGEIRRALTPDELGALALLYGDDTCASCVASAASLSFGPDRQPLQDIIIEKDVHRSRGNPAPAIETNDNTPLQTLPLGTRLVGNLFDDQTVDARDRYFVEIPAIPAGQQSVSVIFDIDAGREHPTVREGHAKSGDLRLRILTGDGATQIDLNNDARMVDEGSLFTDDPLLAHDFTEAEFKQNNGRRFIVEVLRQRANFEGQRDVDYVLEACTPGPGGGGNGVPCGCPTCVVPEPAVPALVAVGLVAAALGRRRGRALDRLDR